MQLKQNQRIYKLLVKHFEIAEADCSGLQIKKFGAKKSIFKMGDLINNLYFIVSGQVSIIFHEKQQPLPIECIVGDYEPSHQLSRRITQLKCTTSVKVIILPFDYYFNLRESKFQDEKFIKECITLSDKLAQYLIIKIAKKQVKFKGDLIDFHKIKKDQIMNHKQDSLATPKKNIKIITNSTPAVTSNVVLIQEGSFKIKKSISIGVLRKQKLQVQKQFEVVEIGPKQIVTENIICQSSKGIIFLFEQYFINRLANNFEQLKFQLIKNEDHKQSHRNRCIEISEACRARSKLLQLILPTVIKQQTEQFKIKLIRREKFNKKNKSRRFNTEKVIENKLEQQNHYQIIRNSQQKDKLTCIPTNLNLSLVPLVKRRYPTSPNHQNPQKKDHLLEILKYKNKELYEIEQSERSINSRRYTEMKKSTNTYEQIDEIEMSMPHLFDSRFKKKMFLRANNPFHHFKTSVSQQKNQVQRKPYPFLSKRQKQDRRKQQPLQQSLIIKIK